MDRVRFGRALGYGARHAGRAMLEAVEAAAADPPRGQRPPASQPQPQSRTGVRSPLPSTETIAQSAQSVRETVQMAGKASAPLTAPIRRFSAVLWLEVTGAFFGLLALVFAGAALRTRSGFHAGALPDTVHHAWTYAGLTVLFGYFAVSSFVRASRRGRR